MKDYGNFVPEALRNSPDQSLAKIGARLELFSNNEESVMVRGKVAGGTHALINGQSYNYYVRDYYNIAPYTYFMQEVVRFLTRAFTVIFNLQLDKNTSTFFF
jgi:hypothetical protein